jgi:hypothetical protein
MMPAKLQQPTGHAAAPAAAEGRSASVFHAGTVVLVTLNASREKFWGAILDLAPAGVSLRGINLNSFEDFALQVKSGEAATPNAVFFPMHRVERIELDARDGEVPSLQERFLTKTGRHFTELLDGVSGKFGRESGA